MKWLKKIFSKEKEKTREKAEIDIEHLSKWMEDRLNQSFVEIKDEISDVLDKVKEGCTQLQDDLEQLQRQELQNPNIPEKAITVMEGNRTAYVQQHQIFIKQVHFPEELNYRHASNFCEQFEQALLALAKSTGKSHAIMSEFFLDNTRQINKTIKTMSDKVSEIKEQLKDYDIDLEANEKIFDAADDLHSKIRHKRELGKDIELLKKKLENSRELQAKIESKITEMKNSDGYKEFERLDQERSKTKEKMGEIESQVQTLFFSISRPIKKYERMAVDDTIGKYQQNPVQALADDEGMKIKEALKSMAKALRDGKLDVKDPEKTATKVEGIDLADTRKKYVELREKLHDTERKIRSMNALQDIEDQNYKVEHAKNQILLVGEKIEKTQAAFDKINIADMHQRTEQLLSSHFDMDIKITGVDG